jgi:hypothetical protein
MSDLMMNVHTCLTDNTTNTLLYVRSLCQISMSDLMINVHTCFTDHPPPPLTQFCMSDQYICLNDECTYICY